MQQINFYDSLKKSSQYNIVLDKALELIFIAMILIFIPCVIQLLIISYHKIRTSMLNSHVQSLQNDIQDLTTNVSNVKTYLQIENEEQYYTQLISDFDELKKNIAMSQQYKISPYLLALANATTAQVWLSEISIQTTNLGIILNGQATTANFVPNYIISLSRQSIFFGTDFKVLQVNHAQNSPYVNFVLSNS